MTDDEQPMPAIQIRLPQTLIDRIDRYRLALSLKPNRAQTIRFLVENAMNILESQEKHDE